MDHSYFGVVSDVAQLAWNGEIDVDGRRVRVSLTSDEPVSPAQLDAAAVFARDAARFDRVARAAIERAHDARGSVQLYVDHHQSAPRERGLLLAMLVLVHIALHPADPSCAAVFDYTLDGDVTQYVLAVSFDAAGTIIDISMES